ncbi:MAG: maltose alpha-D-glucosyltransferase [Rhodospirillaceae bacterium]|nr:maltose alpha-D-glucosyltransferase [Rhodospirillaceae bacterium]
MSEAIDPLWYKDAVVYEVQIRSFFDANNDGVGDLPGLTAKLDYLKDLGITAIWLLPFYPSPMRDDGYDIADYRSIKPEFGTLRDFKRFLRAAHARGLKVITELVINHTSDQHPWFQRARRAKRDSSYRRFYVWSDDDRRWPETRIIFTDTEPSNWTWDPVAQQYYWHRFFSHQPDLNFDNPRVVKAVIDIMRYWLNMGVDGLRLDAIPYLVERDGTNNENLPETHAIIKRLRAALDESHPHAFFLAEANQWPEDTAPYFGDGDECHMTFHFPLMPRIYMAIAQEDRHPITDILRQTPEIPPNCQWGIFLRNHDELTLEMVTERERDYLWQFYAGDQRARLNLGIRRRLAPLMENDRRKIELMNSLLFSMPGTPFIYYGDEIGMGDNIYLGDRNGVRTPMQWSPDRNGGFSRADPASLYLPPIMDPIYGYEAVNVEAQLRNPSSLLAWTRSIVHVRQQHQAFGRGSLTLLYPGNRKILAYVREYQDETILCVANLARSAQAVELDLARYKDRVPVEMLAGTSFPPVGELPYLLTLPAYGFYWFVLAERARLPPWHVVAPEPLPDLVTLPIREGWRDLLTGRNGQLLAGDILPAYLAKQRWFAAKGQRIAAVRVGADAEIAGPGQRFLLAVLEVETEGQAAAQRYFLPLAQRWDETVIGTVSPLLPYVAAKVRRGAKLGGLIDATVEPAFTQAVIAAMRANAEVPTDGGTIRFSAGQGLDAVETGEAEDIRRFSVEQSNTSIQIGARMVLKILRRLSPGIHPEIEMNRFLTEVASFPYVPAYLGAAEIVAADGTSTAIACLQAFVRNQGNGWTYTLDYLSRELEQVRQAPEGAAAAMPAAERHAVYLNQAATLGRQTAELHRALALKTGDPAFDPEPITAADREALLARVREQAERAFTALQSALPSLSGEARAEAEALLKRRRDCRHLITRLGRPFKAVKTRYHGDLHLGQVLVAQTDFIFVDFEGEPERSLEERRAKQPPLRDVAGMVRSFDYAAWGAVDRLSALHPDRSEQLAQDALEWRNLAVQAYLDSYIAAIAGTPSFPDGLEAAMRLRDLLVLEKALYEIVYEINNRPAWLPIPLRGISGLLGAHLGS